MQSGNPADLPQLNPGLFIYGFRGHDAETAEAIIRSIRDGYAGGVYLSDKDLYLGGDRNVKSPQQLMDLIAALKDNATFPLIVAADQEGIGVNRLDERFGFPQVNRDAFRENVEHPAVIYDLAEEQAIQLKYMGINVNFAPCVDLNTNPNNPVIGARGRSFSADPELVISSAKAFIEAHNKHGIITVLKHFPGHGSSSHDSHEEFTDVTNTWGRDELEPYKRLIDDEYAQAIMSSHVYMKDLDPKHPASLSEAVLQSILREELGFEGIVFSDDLQMGAISKHYDLSRSLELAMNSGTDILIFANNSPYDEELPKNIHHEVMKLLRNDRINEEKLHSAQQRIEYLQQKISSNEHKHRTN